MVAVDTATAVCTLRPVGADWFGFGLEPARRMALDVRDIHDVLEVMIKACRMGLMDRENSRGIIPRFMQGYEQLYKHKLAAIMHVLRTESRAEIDTRAFYEVEGQRRPTGLPAAAASTFVPWDSAPTLIPATPESHVGAQSPVGLLLPEQREQFFQQGEPLEPLFGGFDLSQH